MSAFLELSTHLSSTNNRLSDFIGTANHHFLRQKDLLRWDFNAEISTSHHQAIALLQDLIQAKRKNEYDKPFSELY